MTKILYPLFPFLGSVIECMNGSCKSNPHKEKIKPDCVMLSHIHPIYIWICSMLVIIKKAIKINTSIPLLINY